VDKLYSLVDPDYYRSYHILSKAFCQAEHSTPQALAGGQSLYHISLLHVALPLSLPTSRRKKIRQKAQD